MIVVLLPDGGRGYLSKIFNDDWMADYGFLTAETTEPGRRRAGRQGGGLPEFVHPHPHETVGPPSRSCASTGCRSFRWCKAEPPVMAAEVVGAISERDLLEALIRPAPLGGRIEPHMSRRCR